MYILEYTNVDTQSQEFEEDIVTMLSWRGPNLLFSQNQSLRREIMLPAQSTKSFFVRPDAAGMDEAISKFLHGLEGQECSGFEELHQFLAKTF